MEIRKKMIIALVSAALVMVMSQVLIAQNVKIDINSATVEQLQNLKYVGPKYAQRIVEYRNSHGPFKKVEDIMNVPGIGTKIFENNKDLIYVSSKAKAKSKNK